MEWDEFVIKTNEIHCGKYTYLGAIDNFWERWTNY
jgi:hypothetical protein